MTQLALCDTIRERITLNLPNDLAPSKLLLWHGREQCGARTLKLFRISHLCLIRLAASYNHLRKTEKLNCN